MRQLEWTLATIGSLLVAACGTTRLDAGSNDHRDAGDDRGHVWVGTPSNSYNQPCDAPAADWLAGKWSGTFDAFSLPSGSKSIEVDIKGSYLYPGDVCGTVTFGNGAPLSLPKDAASPPPGVDLSDGDPRRVIREGFPYEFYVLGHFPSDGGGFVTGGPIDLAEQRVRFPINVAQYFNAWCNMQPAYYHKADSPEPPAYTCVPPGGTVVDGMDPTCSEYSGPTYPGVSCAQMVLCKLDLCYCTGPVPSTNAAPRGIAALVNYGCEANSAGITSFDVTVSNDAMTGSLIFFESVESLHLTRIP